MPPVTPTPHAAGFFYNDNLADEFLFKVTLSAILASIIGIGWTLVVFSKLRSRSRILYLSQTAAGVLMSIHAIMFIVSDQILLGVIVFMIGNLFPFFRIRVFLSRTLSFMLLAA